MTSLAIAIPCHVFIAPQMAQSLAMLTADLASNGVPFALRLFGNCSDMFGRNELTRWAFEIDSTHILWIDTDSVFPANAARRLLAHNLPFVAANFARKWEKRDSAVEALDGERLIPRREGIEKVRVVGCGFTLMEMKVLDAVGEPWWRVQDSARLGPGDEFRFCRIAREAGFYPYVDHALSLECGHVGLYEFKLQDRTDEMRQIMNTQIENVPAFFSPDKAP